ncbi:MULTISPECIES: arginine-ornithine antiporter [Virgibacillus]|uniref:Arginine-ornithine antiporter n=2 Tax=Virgibacillus TaxID=84406 RepID=A0A1M5TVI6_9BACI|nr:MULTISPECIES: arginine-ornithine antiporter [Virgibacillus]AUJ23540.1 Arginine/ornithine antiporter [Virgibacillus dokdonensis]NWO14918.1 arginine-ornithine antiporter [Virgibacillus sp.]SHH54413.1 arginine:ornithine antiporter / lysine permease [Virgibacillus chiguensis]
MSEDEKKLGLVALIALVVGSMVGGGAFNLAGDIALGSNSGAAIIGWIITGIGIVALAFVFQNLTQRKPELDSGIYSYAKAGFGTFLGFNSAWGYWLSAFLGNVAYATLVFSSIGYFIPMFEGGQNVASIIGASVVLWSVHFLVLRGVSSAALINTVATIAKVIPIFLFIIIAIIAFKWDTFSFEFWGSEGFSWASVGEQVRSMMLVTLWVFIGVEGAVVMSGRARNRSDVGKATVIGLISVLLIYILISLLSLGIMSREELANLPNPAMAYVLEEIVGKWGAIVINLGLIISVMGAWLGWTLFAAELPYVTAKDKVFPKWLAKENKNHAPVNSLWLTNGLIQLFLITLLFSEAAYNFMFSLATSAILIPYMLSAFYQVKLTMTGEGYEVGEKRIKEKVIGFIASIYALWLVYAAGISYLLLTMLLYAPGIILYKRALKENGIQKQDTKVEKSLMIAFVVLAVIAIGGLVTGRITI